MDFASTPEQALLQRTAREVLTAIAPMSQVRAMMADARGISDAHEHLAGAFAWIAAQQRERDAARLANPKITLGAKQRIRTAAAPL